MTKQTSVEDPIGMLALLGDPKRRRLYELVATSDRSVGRDEAAGTLAISRELAAFHLDRLVAAGLLDTEYRRLGGRRGPGAGRPAKLYRRAEREVAVSLPPRHYDLAADLMATALDRLEGAAGAQAAAAVASERGSADGAAARRKVGERPGRRRSTAALVDVLRGADYEPHVDASTGTLVLRNCPFHDLAADHRDLTCGMNLAWAEGVVDSLGSHLRAELAPEPGRCCVVFRAAPGGADTATGLGPEPVTTSDGDVVAASSKDALSGVGPLTGSETAIRTSVRLSLPPLLR
jgi:predicted ArsR family transcriptional regulator